MDQEFIVPVNGAQRDPRDERDQDFRDLIASGAVAKVTDEEKKKGFSVYELLGIAPEVRDQGGRSSCTCEAGAMYARVLRKKVTGDDVIFAATSAYPFIALPGGGAYIRDAAKAIVDGRFAPKSVLPDEDANGNPLSEAAGTDKSRITAAVAAEAKKLDVFDNYRALDAGTDDIDIFATAIREGFGTLLGFTGTNNGWCSCPVIAHPKQGEMKWNHCVFGGEFGLTDVEECGIPVGTFAIFIPGSWGGRYTFTSGRWKGRSAITAEYFAAGEQTAVGFVKGIYVFPSWTVIPSAIVPPNQWAADYLKRHDRKLARNTGTGERALILQGRLKRIVQIRAGFAALSCIDYGIDQTRRVDITPDEWEKLLPLSEDF